MSKVFAILGDIHANLEALNVVLDDCRAQGVTDYLCTGDLVGYNACPRECLEAIRSLGCPVVIGNHDFYVCSQQNLDDFNAAAAQVVEWTREQLFADDLEWLRQLPFTRTATGITIVHSTMDNPGNFGYVFDNLQAEANYAADDAAVFHCTLPMTRENSGVYRTPQNFTRRRPQVFSTRSVAARTDPRRRLISSASADPVRRLTRRRRAQPHRARGCRRCRRLSSAVDR